MPASTILTEPQYAVIAAHIAGDPTLADEVAAHDYVTLAAVLNMDAAPAFWVWRTRVPKRDLTKQPSSEGTTFTFEGNGFILRSPGEHKAWDEVFDLDGSTLVLDASLPQVVSALEDIFSGTGFAAANLAHCFIVMRRKATRAEHLFATGAGGTTISTVGRLVWEGTIRDVDIAHALDGFPL